MKVYPAIYESTDGDIYLYKDKFNYYSYERGAWDKTDNLDDHENDANITAEYLTNTYGEVKSKEHAEFIVKLAEVAKCAGLEVAKHKIANAENFKGICFNFYTDNGNLWFAFHHEGQAKNRGEKLITIPLPPKEKEESMSNNGDNLMFGGDDKCSEWPRIGSEVTLTDQSVTGVVRCIADNVALVRIDTGNYWSGHIRELQKPKTAEEELRDELAQVMSDSYARVTEVVKDKAMFRHYAKDLMSSYNITKKPQ